MRIAISAAVLLWVLAGCQSVQQERGASFKQAEPTTDYADANERRDD